MLNVKLFKKRFGIGQEEKQEDFIVCLQQRGAGLDGEGVAGWAGVLMIFEKCV